MGMRMYDVRETAGGTTVKLAGRRLDAALATDFRAGLTDLIDKGTTRLTIDLSQVDFIDSSGLGALVGVLKHSENACELTLAGLRRPVRKVFDLTRMATVFRIVENAPSS